MKHKTKLFLNQYRRSLLTHLNDTSTESLDSKHELGDRATEKGLSILNLVKIHQQVIVENIIPEYSAKMRSSSIKRATQFFISVITPITDVPTSPPLSVKLLKQNVRNLIQSNAELAAAKVDLKAEATQRKKAGQDLKDSKKHFTAQLKESNRQQEQLRRLSRDIISSQENERKHISRELHDVIAQTLAGINIRLSVIQKEAEVGNKSLYKNILETQQLVENSVNIVHRFARDLRPEFLDDHGLIPTLNDAFKLFTERTGIQIKFDAYAGAEKMSMVKRTALYRLINEALSNIDQHAKANQVKVCIHKVGDNIVTTIQDNGKSFNVAKVKLANCGKQLGLLGMQERIEMVGGQFNIYSMPGKGTTIIARISYGKSKPITPLSEAEIVKLGEAR